LNLASGRWQKISLPCVPSVNALCSGCFGDDLNGAYGADWAVYSYDAVNNGYEDVGLNDTLKQGVGYWVIHHNGVNAELDLPEGSTQTMVTPANQCAGDKACNHIPLVSRSGQVQWNMVGYPFFNEVGLDRLRVVTKGGACVGGCSLDEAKRAGIVEDRFWHYEGGGYEVLEGSGQLHSWDGFWVAVLAGGESVEPRLEILVE
jgi:hypothetical protein